MIEKVARALCDDTLSRWRSPIALQAEPWREFIPAARAAIGVLQEPTPEMIEEGRAAWLESASDYTRLDISIAEAFKAMINAAVQTAE